MAETERTEENDTVPPEIKPRGLQRTGNFRKNIRKKYTAQHSDPGYTERKLYSSAERPKPITKSSTMPNMLTYGSQSSISSESSADSSYISMDGRNASIDTKDRNLSASSDVSSDANYDVTNVISTFAQNTISDLSSRIQMLENITTDKESNYLSDSDISNRQSNGVKTKTFENQTQNGEQLDQNHSTNEETGTINQTESTNKDTASSALDESLQVIGSAATSIGVDLARGVGEFTCVIF